MEAYRRGRRNDRICYYEKAIRTASRAPDPYQLVTGKWIIRRLSPDSNPIELAHLPDERDDEVLLYAKAQPSLAFLPYGSAWPPCWDFPTRSRPLHVSRRWP